VGEQVALALHDRQLAEHGGPSGLRDAGALASALARPVNRWGYGEDDLCALAAALRSGSHATIPSPTATSARPG
jgi:death-on-curing protein